jgi:hypothetical protein
MIDQIQPMMFMMLSSMKNNGENCFTQYLTLLVLLMPIISKLIQYEDIKDYIKNYFKINNNYISINISSHEVPVLRGCSTTPITKLVYSKDFLSIIHFLTENKIENLESLTEIMSSNSELDIRSYYDDNHKDNKFIYIPIHNTRVLISEKDQIYFELNDIDIKNDEDTKDDKKTVKVLKKKNFIIILSISNKIKNGIDILKKFIEKCRETYDLYHNKNQDDNKQYIFEYKNCS